MGDRIVAKFTFKAAEEYSVKLSNISSGYEEIAKEAVYEGAKVVADKIRGNLEKLEEDKFRMLKKGEQFSGVSRKQKEDLLSSLGITPIKKDKEGNINAKIGFDGYGKYPTKKYKKGTPNKLLARVVESGSTVRLKTPFVRPAVNATKKNVQEKMNETIEEGIKKKMEGK